MRFNFCHGIRWPWRLVAVSIQNFGRDRRSVKHIHTCNTLRVRHTEYVSNVCDSYISKILNNWSNLGFNKNQKWIWQCPPPVFTSWEMLCVLRILKCTAQFGSHWGLPQGSIAGLKQHRFWGQVCACELIWLCPYLDFLTHKQWIQIPKI